MTISKWPFLEELNLEGNQVTYNKSYKDLIILASKSLGKLIFFDINLHEDFMFN